MIPSHGALGAYMDTFKSWLCVTIIFDPWVNMLPIESMHGLFTYISHEKNINM